MNPLGLVIRNLRVRSVRSALTLIGILVATASMVIFLSFGEGMRRAVGDQIAQSGAPVQLIPAGQEGIGSGMPEVPAEVLPKLDGLADELGIRRVIPTAILFRAGADPLNSFIFQGIPADIRPDEIYLGLEIAAGEMKLDPGEAVVGYRVAQRHELEIGSPLRLSQEQQVRVAGILAESNGLGDSLIFVPIDIVQSALGTQNATLVMLQLEPGADPEKVAERIEAEIPEVQAQTSGDLLFYAGNILQIVNIVQFGISFVALVVGGLLVANTVLMNVYERFAEFGIMRAMGAKQGFVFRLVLLESLMLAVVGGVFGSLGAYLASIVMNAYTIAQIGIPLSAVTPRLVLFAFLVSLALGVLSGLLPARTASKIPVVEALGRV